MSTEEVGEIMRRKGINNVPVSIKVVQALKTQGLKLPPYFLTYDEHSGSFSLLDTKHPQFADRVWGANGFAGNASPTSRLRRPPGEFKSLSESMLLTPQGLGLSPSSSSRSSSPTPTPTLALRSNSPPPPISFVPQLSQTPSSGSLSPLPKLATIPPINSHYRGDLGETGNRWAKYISH